MQWVIQKRVQDFPELVADPGCIDSDHEADPVIVRTEVHGVVKAIDDAHAFLHDVEQAGHVDVVQLPVDVAGFHQSDVAVVVGVVRMIRKLAVGDEPIQ